MIQLSNRVQQLGESATLKMAQLARSLKAQGKPIISLTLGEPDFDTPEHIKQAAVEALVQGYTKYTPVPGILELRQAICNKLQKDNNLSYKPEEIVVSNGAKQSFSNLCNALINEGDEVAVIAPYWVSYKEIIELSGGTPVYISAGIEQNYKITAQQLAQGLTDKTKMLIFSSPCNPTGAVFSKEELISFCEVLKNFPNVLIVSDEIYEYINFTHEGHTSIAAIGGESIKARTAVINGFSKGYAMTGWRLGYIAAPKWLADACSKIQGQCTSGACSFSQRAAITALEQGMDIYMQMTSNFLKRRDLLLSLLQEIKGIKCNLPQGAFYVFPDISEYIGKEYKGKTIQSAEDFCLFLLDDYYVATVAGEGFGAPTCMRISYATSEEELREACKRIAEFVAQIQ